MKKPPIDIIAVINAATDIDKARATSLSVSIYIDGTAPDDLIGYVRSSFGSDSDHARVSMTYIEESGLVIHEGDDMAVLVAGLSEDIGLYAGELRNAGIPTMVATTLPSLVDEIAAAVGHAIPQGDVVSPIYTESELTIPERVIDKIIDYREKKKKAYTEVSKEAQNTDGKSGCDAEPDADTDRDVANDQDEDAAYPEPYKLTKWRRENFNDRMGQWIITVCESKKLAFALAFPFVRKPLAREAINATSIQNAGIGVVTFIPGADLPLMTLNQAKMMLQIAAAYGKPMSIDRVKELVAVVINAFMWRNTARMFSGMVPALGWAIKGGAGYAGTHTLGSMLIEYFEAGGDLKGLANVAEIYRDTAIDMAETFAHSKAVQKVTSIIKTKAHDVVAAVKNRL